MTALSIRRLSETRTLLEKLCSLAAGMGPRPLKRSMEQTLDQLRLVRLSIFEKPAPVALPVVVAATPAPKAKPPAPAPLVRKPQAPSTDYNPERYVPYKVLWAKAIIRASYDYALWKDSKDLRLRKFAQDAEKWLFEPSTLELSFENICYAFDFPVERIRSRTRKLTKDDVKKLEFRERHGRAELLGEPNDGNDG